MLKNKPEERRILADSEIDRLLIKLNSIDPLLANTWSQFFKDNSNIEIIEWNINYLDYLIYYQDKNGLISSILVKGNLTANFKFNKTSITEKLDKQIKAKFAIVILQNSEEKTEVVTFNLENVIYNKLSKNLTIVTATTAIIKFHEFHIYRIIRDKIKNSALRLELIS
ncbi:2002_t:CDS:2 [Gigaspora margarita]|uniref:2002_t:CDS:1 n=1 Tax=Gigaspora margarita TaxID=4874 RepID=A0ABN7V1W9_GIGMA|nr:2002_t:CDS:2 [Gigaspora margarita]